MADSYIRQSTFADGDVISAEHGNKEFNQLVKAFHAINGHNHDGTQQGGASITDIADRDRTQTLGIRTTGVVGSVVDTDNTLASDDDGKLVSQKAIKAYVDQAESDAIGTAGAATDSKIQAKIVDEDTMISNSDDKIPTQQSVKAYTDQAKLDAVSQADLNRTNNLIDEDSMATNSATRPASQQSIVAYVNAQLSTATGNVISGTVTNTEKLGNQLPSYYENIPARLGFTPVQQGGGNGQGTNKIYIGWGNSNALRLQVDGTNFGSTWPITSRDTQLLEGFSKATIVAEAKASTVSQTEVSESNVSNTIVKRDIHGDVHCRLLRSEYDNQNTINGAMAFRMNSAENTFLRFCDDKAAIRKFLQVEEGSSEINVNQGQSLDLFVKSGKFRVHHAKDYPLGYVDDNDFLLEVSSIGNPVYAVQVLKDVRSYREYSRSIINNSWGEWLAAGPVFKRVGAAGFNAPDGYNSYGITIYNTTSTTQVLPPNPTVGDTVVIKKVRNIGMLTITASKNMYEDTNWNGGLSHNVTKACILSFIFDGGNWVLSVK